jgi:peroxiredoxin Q/BCP
VFNGTLSWRFRARERIKQPEEIMSQFVNRLTRLTLAAFLAAVALGSQFAAALEVGDKAPDFTLQASDGQTYSMSQFLGEKPVVIAFFPKAFTGG